MPKLGKPSNTRDLPNIRQPLEILLGPANLTGKFLHPSTSTSRMSSTIVVSQLNGLVQKVDQTRRKLHSLHPSNEQWQTLLDLGHGLHDAAFKLQQDLTTLHESRKARALKDSERYISHAQATKDELLAKGRLKSPVIFRRNITVIFEGPKISTFDSEETRIKKESTRKRCDTLRNLGADGLISWAIAYAPTAWALGTMASDIFECLLEDVEPVDNQEWPKLILETLHRLEEEEHMLQRSPEFKELLRGA